MGHDFLCIIDTGCILNFEQPFWFPTGQDMLDSSHSTVQAELSKVWILNSVTALFQMGIAVALGLVWFGLVFSGRGECLGEQNVCEHRCAHSVGLKSSSQPLN